MKRKKKSVVPKAEPCDPSGHVRKSRPRPWGNDAAFERAAGLFRAAADVTRLRLLTRLAESEWCVTELAEATGATVSEVSKQLRVLRLENLVKQRREAKHIYYALSDDHILRLIRSGLDHAHEPALTKERRGGDE
jgi:ArsR family transcriptional regulator, lead/cadmium/zinc/bismuth-responsive transcriptional repressor